MRRLKLFYGSSYDRGLDNLLYMWPDVIKEHPDAELHICYGWDLFDKGYSNNPERMQWKKTMEMLMQQQGITHHGRVGKEELAKIRKECGVWAYPTYFDEINCITALDCQKDGVVPVVINKAALEETVGSGVKVEGDINKEEVQKVYLKELLSLLDDQKRWQEESDKARKFARGYGWGDIAMKWHQVFDEPRVEPLVSIITPTIREGWWNIMAFNLSKQTYTNFEWIIVDDYREDRTKVAEKYAKQYGLKIKYIRGDKALKKYNRKCGLVRANNIGWQNAEGELCLWLQDFIIIPFNGIENLVDLSLKNPDAIIAPVDTYYHAKPANKDNKEDWWDGETKILTEKGWTNPRVINEGIRETENPYDYEANYGLIPKRILVELNGWWEFMDDGLGFDNTEIALRALLQGYRIIVDDTNVCTCINIWPEVTGTAENILSRDRMLNPPRYLWLSRGTQKGKLPIVRDEKLDQTISLQFEVPKEIEDKDCAKWIKAHVEEIISKWS